MRGRFLSLIAFAALGGCVSMDTGYIDYRRAEAPLTYSSNDNEKNCGREDFARLEKPPRQSTMSHDQPPQPCYPLLGARLFRKNMAGNAAISANDVFSIRLDHGFMNYVSEFPFRPARILDGRSPFRAQAEIVVLARAFEFGAKAKLSPAATSAASTDASALSATPENIEPANIDETAFVDLEFESLNSARVIYYSPDVEAEQSLNFSNIPILGPVRYTGRPIGIQIIVLELDRVSAEMKGLLSSLASVGQAAGAIPGGGAAGILTNLGKSLIESNQDDIIFEYRFVLDPDQQINSYNSAPFEAGRYVLRRVQRRDEPMVWRNLLLDHNTGQLFLATDPTKDLSIPYKAETYFTVSIIDHGPHAKEGHFAYITHQRLNEIIRIRTDTTSTPLIAALDQEIRERTKTYQGAVATQNLAALWEDVRANVHQLAWGFASNEPPPDNSCRIDPKRRFGRELAEYQVAHTAGNFVTAWSAAVANSDKATFGTGERMRVANMVASLFFASEARPWDSEPKTADFLTQEAFGSLLTSTDVPFYDRLLSLAKHTRPNTCQGLIDAGLADPVATTAGGS